jgi:hypothetical protein
MRCAAGVPDAIALCGMRSRNRSAASDRPLLARDLPGPARLVPVRAKGPVTQYADSSGTPDIACANIVRHNTPRPEPRNPHRARRPLLQLRSERLATRGLKGG